MADLGVLTTLKSAVAAPGTVAPGWSGAALATVQPALPYRARGIPVWGVALGVQFGTVPAVNGLTVQASGKLNGTVSNGATPVGLRYIVRCYHRSSGNFVAQTFTDAAGNYQFLDLDPTDQYTIVAFDAASASNAVVQDYAVPTDMTALAGLAVGRASASGNVLVNGV